MAHALKGIVKGIRPVTGQYTEGQRKGQEWFFLSLEIHDTKWGETYSCQLPEEDPQYKEYVQTSGHKGEDGYEVRELMDGKDLRGHEVQVSIIRQIAGERVMKQRVFKASEGKDGKNGKNIGMEEQAVPTIRSVITKIQDLGLPEDDDF